MNPGYKAVILLHPLADIITQIQACQRELIIASVNINYCRHHKYRSSQTDISFCMPYMFHWQIIIYAKK